MAVNRDTSADHLTFSQRHGYELLPEPMRLEQISDDLRREIWNITWEFFRGIIISNNMGMRSEPCFSVDVSQHIEVILGKLLKKPEDEIDTSPEAVLSQFKTIIIKHPFNEVFDFFEYFFNDIIIGISPIPDRKLLGYRDYISILLDEHAAAYRLDTSKRPFQFIPRSSKEEGEAVQKAIETIQEEGMDNASNYLRKAADKINKRQFSEAVRDSIDAVESVARCIAPKSSTLGGALKSLAKNGLLSNNELKAGFEKLYAYTNSAAGIRHPTVLKDSSDVGLDEAVFMFGACASFAAYLVSKHRQQAEGRESDG